MAIKIFWGPPGSYKTSSAISEEVKRAATEGRVLVTNIRGLTAAKVREHFPGKVAHGFDVIKLAQSVPEDVDKMRRWWHWAPFGSVIVFDEIQAIYPPDWSASKLHELDMVEPRRFPPTEENPEGELVPTYVGLIFDMHRHGNWDIVFTTPNIRKVRPEIRAAAECAYKHKNLAIIGFPGFFTQSMHLAEDNGNASDMYAIRRRKIPAWVYPCYSSTATGAVRDSKSGLSILANLKILVLLGVIAGAVALVVSKGVPRAIAGGDVPKPTAAPSPAPGAPAGGVAPASQGLRDAGGLSVGNQPSKLWRIVQVSTGAKRDWFYIASKRQVRPVLPDMCSYGATGWYCRVEDGIATMWTGPEPETEAPASQAIMPTIELPA